MAARNDATPATPPQYMKVNRDLYESLDSLPEAQRGKALAAAADLFFRGEAPRKALPKEAGMWFELRRDSIRAWRKNVLNGAKNGRATATTEEVSEKSFQNFSEKLPEELREESEGDTIPEQAIVEKSVPTQNEIWVPPFINTLNSKGNPTHPTTDTATAGGAGASHPQPATPASQPNKNEPTTETSLVSSSGEDERPEDDQRGGRRPRMNAGATARAAQAAAASAMVSSLADDSTTADFLAQQMALLAEYEAHERGE